MTGEPWDTDGSENCPPEGDDDVRCEWTLEHVGDDDEHRFNGVLAAVMDGSAPQSAVFLSEVWADSNNSGSIWWVDYDVHFVAIDPADIVRLRVISRYKHDGATRLTLFQSGPPSKTRVRHVVAPRHFWTDTPETGKSWRVELTLQRTLAGTPAMVWVDNIHVTEGPETLFLETFPVACPADVDGSGQVDFDDLLAVLGAWGPYDPCPPYKPEDVDQDCDVGFDDLLAVLGAWGDC